MKRFLVTVITAISAASVAAAGVQAAPALAAQQSGPVVNTIMVGSDPAGIAISESQSKAYVVNGGSVSVLSLVTHTQLAEVSTGTGDQVAIALVSGDTEAYIATFDLKVVKVLNTTTLKVIKTIRVGAGATDIVAADTKAGEYAYVTRQQSNGSAGTVAVVRTSSGKRVKTVKLPAGAQTATTTPDNKDVWVGSVESGEVWVVSTAAQKIVQTIPVTQSGPVSSIAFTPDGTQAWVFGIGGMSVVDVAAGKVLSFVPVTGIFPNSQAPNAGPVALTRSGQYALAVDSTPADTPGLGAVAVLSTSTLKLLYSIPVGAEPLGLAIDYDGQTAYVTNYGDGTVSYFTVPG